jgi:C4-dicarboxylate-specific signal transduction histidine kinase
MSGVAEPMVAGWPLAGALAMLLLGERLRAGRRRQALNRAVHELRRPLQLLALAPPSWLARSSSAPLELAIAALAQLDREINGGGGDARRLVSSRELVGGAVGRWRGRARLCGGSIALRWRAGGAPVIADPVRISQALDNLIVNALEHGGPNVVVEARAAGGRLRISVADDGGAARPASRSGAPADVVGRLTGRRRHGHGLEVVRSVAASHRGRFALQRSESGSVAMLELPLAGAGDALAA